MKEILRKLQEWAVNIECDLSSGWPTVGERAKMQSQLFSIQIAISQLKSIGDNNNIPE